MLALVPSVKYVKGFVKIVVFLRSPVGQIYFCNRCPDAYPQMQTNKHKDHKANCPRTARKRRTASSWRW